MKTKILLSSLAMLFISIINAQNRDTTIGLTGGYTPGGFAANVNVNYYIYDNYLQAGIYASFSTSEYGEEKIPYNIMSLNIGYFYTLLEDYRQLSRLAIGGGATGGYELINNGNKELQNGAIIESNSKFIYGAFVSGEFDFSITDRIWLIAKYNQYYHANSEVGKFTLYAGAGLRIAL